MGHRWVLDPSTGTFVAVSTDDPSATPTTHIPATPATTPPAPTMGGVTDPASPATALPSLQDATIVPPGSPYDLFGAGTALRNRVANSRWTGHSGATPSTPTGGGSHGAPGSIIGGMVANAGNQQPPNFGDPNQILPEDQQYQDTIESLIQGLGGAAPPAAPTLPDAPTYTADPGLQTMADRATARDAQTQELLQSMIGDMRESDPQARNRWARFGEFLSGLAANGNLANAGQVMADQLSRDRGMHMELQRSIMQLQLAGMSSQDAQAQATAALLSGRHAAQEHTQEAAYNRGVAQTGITAQYDTAAFASNQNTVRAQAALASDLASSTRDAHGRARAEHNAVLGALAGTPYAAQAARDSVPTSVTDPAARNVLGSALTEHQATQGLMAQISNWNITDGTSRTQLAQYLRQWNPSITPETIQREGAMGTFLRAIQGPGAQAAFQAHPELARLAPYAAAPAQ